MRSNKESTPQQTIFKSCQSLGTVSDYLLAASKTETLPGDVAGEMRRIAMEILNLHTQLTRIWREGFK